ncbi:hypothetical protein BDC45DRAFT_276734 [Circinella umbellata]|nr:hypothetical protein BDC45DRAFT_276734 [Circinella umbellata]
MHLHQEQERHNQYCNSTVSAQSSPSSISSSFEGSRKAATAPPSPPPTSLAESFFDCIATQNKQKQLFSYHPTEEEQEQLDSRTADERTATLGLLTLRYGQSNNDSGFSTSSTTSLSSNTTIHTIASTFITDFFEASDITSAAKVVTLKQNNSSSRRRQRQKRGDKPNKRSSNKKPRWQDPERGVLFKAIIQAKNLEDMSTFNWDKIAKVVGRCGKACKDQWRREILPALKKSVGIEDRK